LQISLIDLKKAKMRVEKDFLGEVSLKKEALYGINAYRATKNFPLKTEFPIEWYMAMGEVKNAVYKTYQKFKTALKLKNLSLNQDFIGDDELKALQKAACEIAEGKHFSHFIVPGMQGGAGTSINMNINEIITNRALQILGKKPGAYSIIDPFETANIYQSTNDVVPTALKVATMRLLNVLEEKINDNRKELENLEKKYRDNLRIAYTQMQAAVPTSFGNLFSTYNDALSRDWWRVSKALERIKVINLGGGAIGTGIAIPQFFIMEVSETLKNEVKLPITRAENLSDITANQDVFVEVHAILKAHAVNLEKMAADFRLLSADAGIGTLQIPKKQVGSSIMPGKVNPVIVEYLISIAHEIYANDLLISSLAAQGALELNPYIPSIGISIINSLELLIAANESMQKQLLSGMTVDTPKALNNLLKNSAICTALLPYIGYHKASVLANRMKKEKIDIYMANKKESMMDEKKLEQILEPSNLIKQGFSIYDIS